MAKMESMKLRTLLRPLAALAAAACIAGCAAGTAATPGPQASHGAAYISHFDVPYSGHG